MFVEGIQHADVEDRRFVEPAYAMVEEDIGVLEEPGGQHEGQGDAREAGLCRQREKYCENNQDGGRSAAGGAEEVGEKRDVGGVHSINRGA